MPSGNRRLTRASRRRSQPPTVWPRYVLGPEQHRVTDGVHGAVTGAERRRRDDHRRLGGGSGLVGRSRRRRRLGRLADRAAERPGSGEQLGQAVEARGLRAGRRARPARRTRRPGSRRRRARRPPGRSAAAPGPGPGRPARPSVAADQDHERDGATGEVEEQGTAARHGRGDADERWRLPGPAVRGTSADHLRTGATATHASCAGAATPATPDRTRRRPGRLLVVVLVVPGPGRRPLGARPAGS